MKFPRKKPQRIEKLTEKSFTLLLTLGIGVVWGDFGWLLKPSIVRGSF